MAERIIQRIVMPPRRGLTRLYYRLKRGSPQPREQGRRSLVLPRGCLVRTDTWFNAFFESYWREYTNLSRLNLHLRMSGAGTVRLYRRALGANGRRQPAGGGHYQPAGGGHYQPAGGGHYQPAGGGHHQPADAGRSPLLQEIDFSGQDRELLFEFGESPLPSSRFGLLFFEIEAHSSEVVLHQAEWSVREGAARPIQLVAGICTFNRPTQLVHNVAALIADPEVAELLESIAIVDQGRDKGARPCRFRCPGAGLCRSIAACGAGQSRRGRRFHALSPRSSKNGIGDSCLADGRRYYPGAGIGPAPAAFLSLARGDLAVGGHMLDRFRPRQLVESGSRYLPEQVRIDEPRRSRLDRAGDLASFHKPQPRHYNGWWFFAFPLAVLERTGLPLPLFLRGDDLEFGCRLMRQGVQTVSPPGIAVWHEPFERKGRGWHVFYELRNYLIVGALHFPTIGAATVARCFFSRVLDELLTYDYYESWLLCEAAAAYLHGPETLRQPPAALQQHLQTMAAKLASKRRGRDARRTARVVDSAHRAARYSSALALAARSS